MYSRPYLIIVNNTLMLLVVLGIAITISLVDTNKASINWLMLYIIDRELKNCWEIMKIQLVNYKPSAQYVSQYSIM